jgi:enamine deaminase RidA (YjgF/YER057c/UK114 family)
MGMKIECMPFPDVRRQAQAWQDRALGIVCFNESNLGSFNEVPGIHLNTPVLAGEDIACEVWLSDPSPRNNSSSDLVSSNKGAIQYRLNDELLFGVISLDELTFSQGQTQQAGNESSPLQQATESAYRQIFALIDELGYSNLYRFWNYLADINDISHGLERYRQFNVGRKNALMQSGRDLESEMPAACALGLANGPLSIAFLAGKTKAVAIENPRQIKAYDYPEQYGPITPSFSRATLLHSGKQATLFISGTASIVGHQTQHTSDVAAQTRETLLNLEAVIAEANRVLGQPRFNLHDTFLRVYIRYPKDFDAVRAELQRYLKGEINAMFIQADICRHDLLVEIEATIQCVTEFDRVEVA